MCAVPRSTIFCNFLLSIFSGIFLMYLSRSFLISPRALSTQGWSKYSYPTSWLSRFPDLCTLKVFLLLLQRHFALMAQSRRSSSTVFCSLSFTMMSGLFALSSRTVCIGISHSMVHSSFSVTVPCLCSYHFSVAGKL